MINKKSFTTMLDSIQLYVGKTTAIAQILDMSTFGDFSEFAVILLEVLIQDIEGEEVLKSRRKSLLMNYIDTFNWGTEYPDGRCLVCLNGENLCPKSSDELYDVLQKAYS